LFCGNGVKIAQCRLNRSLTVDQAHTRASEWLSRQAKRCNPRLGVEIAEQASHLSTLHVGSERRAAGTMGCPDQILAIKNPNGCGAITAWQSGFSAMRRLCRYAHVCNRAGLIQLGSWALVRRKIDELLKRQGKNPTK
jgi:hypothetical protein